MRGFNPLPRPSPNLWWRDATAPARCSFTNEPSDHQRSGVIVLSSRYRNFLKIKRPFTYIHTYFLPLTRGLAEEKLLCGQTFLVATSEPLRLAAVLFVLKSIMLLNIIRVQKYTFSPNNTTFLSFFSLLAEKTYLLSGSLAPKR